MNDVASASRSAVHVEVGTVCPAARQILMPLRSSEGGLVHARLTLVADVPVTWKFVTGPGSGRVAIWAVLRIE